MGENKTSSIVFMALTTILIIPIISQLVTQADDVYTCLNDTHPYLNISDDLCYNATEGQMTNETTTEIPRNDGLSTSEILVLGLVALILIFVLILSILDVAGVKGRTG